MDTLHKRLRYVAACGLFGTTVAATLAIGCSGDDNNNAGGQDAAPDQTADVSSDVNQKQETSLQDNSVADTSTDSPSNDATLDAAVDSAKADASDASDAAASSDGNDGGVCVTTVASLGGTTPDADAGPAPKILFTFDDGTDAGIDPQWSVFHDSGADDGGTTFPTLNTVDGHPCAGSLTTTATTYTSFGANTQIYYNYGTGSMQDWTGYSTLHFWIKVVTSDPTTISGMEPRIDTTSSYTKYFAPNSFVSGTTLADGAWHEATVSLPAADAGAGFTPSQVVAFQLEFQTVGTSPDGGTAPPPATFLVDSIWLD